MAYATKYRTSYKRRSGALTTIDIQEKNYSGSITELTPDVNPLEINISGDVNNIYAPTQGTGAVIRLLVTPLTLHNEFFTTDPQKYVVKIFNGTTGGTLVWQGFISTGIWQEDYSTTGKVPITLTCNDGLAVLEDISYRVSANGAAYSGFSTVVTVMNNILSKLGISFNTITTSSDILIPTDVSNIFTGITVNNENYYDENGIAMSCRAVLNSIFQPLGLVMSFQGQTIYLVDPINLHSTSKGKTYSINGGSESAYSFGGYVDLSGTTLNYYETGQFIDVVQPFNQVQIKYDPYSFIESTYDFNATGNAIVTGTWNRVLLDDGTSCYWNSGVTMNGWTTTSNAKFRGVRYTNEAPQYFLIQRPSGSASESFSYTFPYLINQDENLQIEFSVDVFVNTIDDKNPFKNSSSIKYHNGTTYVNYPAPTKIDRFFFKTTYFILNSHWYNQTEYLGEQLYHWHETKTYHPLHCIQSGDFTLSVVNDTWTPCKLIIDLSENPEIDLLRGYLTVEFTTNIDTSAIIPTGTQSAIKNILFKDFTIKVIDSGGNVINNNSVLTEATLYDNDTIKKSTLNINLTNGIGTFGISKGAFYSSTAGIISGITRTGLGSNYDSAALLAQNLISQYKAPRIKLNANLDVSSYGLTIKNKLINDNKYLNSKSFYVASGKYNDANESMNCELIEITSTRESITT